jgi:hypothetical protein
VWLLDRLVLVSNDADACQLRGSNCKRGGVWLAMHKALALVSFFSFRKEGLIFDLSKPSSDCSSDTMFSTNAGQRNRPHDQRANFPPFLSLSPLPFLDSF